ncbi:hypothetical protein Dimus_038953 [Dionaea muscipula]
MVSTRTGVRTTPSSEKTPREMGRPPLARGRRPTIGTGANAVPVTHVATEATGSRGQRLSDEEWDIIRQFRARRVDAYAHDAEVDVEVQEEEIEDEVRHPHVPRGAPPTPAPAVVTRAEEEFRGRLFDRFIGARPPTFAGSTDPMDASNWLMGLERVLKRIGCPIDQRISLASYQLREAAEFW